MWLVTIPQLAYFAIRRRRNRSVIKNLLGARWKGILTMDRYSVYSYLPLAQRQLCWAHLLRDFLAMQQWGQAAQQVGAGLHREGKRMFRLWHRVSDGTMNRSQFAEKMQPVQQGVHELLQQGAVLSVKKVARTCRRLLKVEPALWTYVHTQGLACQASVSGTAPPSLLPTAAALPFPALAA